MAIKVQSQGHIQGNSIECVVEDFINIYYKLKSNQLNIADKQTVAS